MDNVFIERLWRSLKHEDIYLKGYADGGEARAGIAAWMEFYNHGRLHQALDYQAPTAVWRDGGFKYAPEVPAGALRPLIQIKREMVDGRPSRDFFLRSLW